MRAHLPKTLGKPGFSGLLESWLLGHQQILQLRRSQCRHSQRLSGGEAKLTIPAAEHSPKQRALEVSCSAGVCQALLPQVNQTEGLLMATAAGS